MKTSMNWLREYTDLRMDDAAFQEGMIRTGTAVERMEPLDGGMQGVVSLDDCGSLARRQFARIARRQLVENPPCLFALLIGRKQHRSVCVFVENLG